MQRYVMVFEYDGTGFSGLQTQEGKRTVQSEIESAMSRIFGVPTILVASGRTDSGVHAIGQVAHFDADYKKDEFSLLRSLNSFLPSDICVREIRKVDGDFHARFDAKRKTYIYKFYISPNERPLYLNRALRVNTGLDVSKMMDACECFVGTKDFKSFCSKKSGKTDFVRTVYSCKITEIAKDEYELQICGNGFLYNMVRIIMGTLLKVGEGKLKKADIEKIFQGKARMLAGRTVPPYGLYLKSVEYERK